MIPLVHDKTYNTPLNLYGITKNFALDRGAQVLEHIKKQYNLDIECIKPEPLNTRQIELIHDSDYVISLHKSEDVWRNVFELKPHEYKIETAQRPLTDLFYDVSFKSGGTVLAARLALQNKLAANMGGGYHHAFRNRGRGFCVINDIAIAIQTLLDEKLINRAMIIDLDFHQGDGTALIFKNTPNVFTLSVHSQEGWPIIKQRSNIDVPIFSNQENLYLAKTKSAINHALSIFSPDIIIFVAGSDPYEKDTLPGTRFINLSLEQMRLRDEFVLDTCFERKIPMAMVFAGGYGDFVWEVHYNAVCHLLKLLNILDKNLNNS